MKYGETLRQRSILAWSHHNVDYDDIKRFIKDQTTPGQGKSIAVPGASDDKLAEFENSLFTILAEQHERIDLFVRSKAGEIRRRLDHSEKQLQSLSQRASNSIDRPIPVSRLERFGRLENDLLRAGEEIKSLARFTSAQRTAFRKLLKKFKKWTGSTRLEDRFREEVTDDPKSFSHLDLGPLLDNYSHTLQRVRALYETRMRQSRGDETSVKANGATSTTVTHLRNAVESGSKAEIDSALATAPFGESGIVASYFVHPECIIEVQMLLLQHCTYCLARSRTNSVTSPISPDSRRTSIDEDAGFADFFTLIADDPARFAQEQSALTFEEREHRPDASPQRARVWAVWNDAEDARVSLRSAANQSSTTIVKKKYLAALLDRATDYRAKDEGVVSSIRRTIEEDEHVRPLYKLSACRSRLIHQSSGNDSIALATLDTSITIQPIAADLNDKGNVSFPFALLTVRQEGPGDGQLMAALEESHLVERIRGFSMEYHAIWQICPQSGATQPPWSSLMSRDIRKLPPPAIKHHGSRSGSASGTRTISTPSERNGTDSATAVETTREASMAELEVAPLRSFRKKRHRLPMQDVPEQPVQKYWSEYDHPEDGEDGEAFVIYVDPNERSAVERLMDKLGAIFRPAGGDDSSNLHDDESSSEDEASARQHHAETTVLLTGPIRIRGRTKYGAFTSDMTTPLTSSTTAFLPPITTLCYVASLAILVVAYFLAYTGKRKYHYTVDAGILLAVSFSVLFAVVGFAILWRHGELARRMGRNTDVFSWTVATTVLVIDMVAAGGLLAWIWTFGRE